jgi:hypothetical protein
MKSIIKTFGLMIIMLSSMMASSANFKNLQKEAGMKSVFNNYFLVKDALIKSDGNSASVAAKDLSNAIKAVEMDALTTQEHAIWMKQIKDLASDAEHIADTKDISHQRDHFTTLSKSIFELIKASKQETPVYYQFCPMANQGKGANWLSKESAIKNPYYGSKMMTCGRVIETIK